MQEIWKDAETLLQRARKLERARRQLQTCGHCAQPIALKSWCPAHDIGSEVGATGGLPQNPFTVWVRTFQIAESIEELQNHERLQNNDAAEEWIDADITAINESDEGASYAQGHER